MGRGPAGEIPLKLLAERFGCYGKAYVLYPRHHVFPIYIKEKSIRAPYAVMIDMMQVIEAGVHRRKDGTPPVQNGEELYTQSVRPAILRWLRQPLCKAVVVCMDTAKLFNRQKEMDYYSLGKRRLGCTSMPTPEGDGIVLDDTRCPLPDDWSAFKMNPVLHNQLDWYFCERFLRETELPGGGLLGEKTVIFDNYIQREHMRTPEPDATPHVAARCIFVDGYRRAPPSLHPASNIAEAELAMDYWRRVLSPGDGDGDRSRPFPAFEHIVAKTTDQDLLSILLCNMAPTDRARVYVVCETSYGPKEARRLRTKIWDMHQLAANIHVVHRDKYGNSHVPLLCEAFLILMGGGDYHGKVLGKVPNPKKAGKKLAGIGYARIHKEFVEQMSVHARMLSVREMPAIMHSGRPLPLRVLRVDPGRFRAFAEAVLRKKTKHWERALGLREPSLPLVPRRIMCTIANYANVPRVRYEHDEAFVVDCLMRDAEGVPIWGYREGPLPRAPGRVVQAAGRCSDCILE